MKRSFNILMATDYSSSVAAAEHYAIRLAMATQSAIRFIHVFRPELMGMSTSFDPEKIDYNPLKYQYDKLCEHVAALMRSMHISPGELDYQCVIREGNSVHRQLLPEADEAGTDLIITGTHGASALSEWFMRSHTWDIIRKANVPVLVIPEDAVFAGVKKIVFAAECREGEIPAVHFLAQLAKQMNAGITVLHITTHVLPEEFDAGQFEKFVQEIKDKVDYDELDFRLIRHDGIIGGLNRFCEEQEVSWLVMSPQRTSWLDKWLNPADTSITKHMGFHTRTPLFILPDFYNTLYGELIKTY